MTGKAPKGKGYTIKGVIFLYVAGTLWQTSLMWQCWLNVNEYQGQHLIGCPFPPPHLLRNVNWTMLLFAIRLPIQVWYLPNGLSVSDHRAKIPQVKKKKNGDCVMSLAIWKSYHRHFCNICFHLFFGEYWSLIILYYNIILSNLNGHCQFIDTIAK